MEWREKGGWGYCFYSLNFKGVGVITTDEDHLDYDEADYWANYPKAMVKLLKKQGYPIQGGLEIAMYGSIPTGSGLSSSASVEVLSGLLLSGLYVFSLRSRWIWP